MPYFDLLQVARGLLKNSVNIVQSVIWCMGTRSESRRFNGRMSWKMKLEFESKKIPTGPRVWSPKIFDPRLETENQPWITFSSEASVLDTVDLIKNWKTQLSQYQKQVKVVPCLLSFSLSVVLHGKSTPLRVTPCNRTHYCTVADEWVVLDQRGVEVESKSLGISWSELKRIGGNQQQWCVSAVDAIWLT